MTPLSRRLLVRILFRRWLDEKKPDRFMDKTPRMLDKILNEEELDSQGGKMIIWPTTTEDKRRVIRDLRSRINDQRAVAASVGGTAYTRGRSRKRK